MSREVLGPPGDGVVPAWGDHDAPAATPPGSTRTGTTHSPGGPVRVTDLDRAGASAPPTATATLPAPRGRGGTGTGGTPPDVTAADATASGPTTAGSTACVTTPDITPDLTGADLTGADLTAPAGTATRDTGAGTSSGRGDGAWPTAAPPWARGPWGLVAAVVAGVLVGALAAGALAERSRQAAESEQVQVLADLAAPVRDDIGTGMVQTGIDVVNAGPAAVTVVGADLAPGDDVVEVVARRRVEPGDHVVVPVTLVPACDGPLAETLTLVVATGDGGTTRVPAGSLGGRGLQPRQLRDLCSAVDEPIEIWRVLSRRDGTLTVQLLNTSGDDHRVGIALPPGSSATSIPPLPTTVPAGRSAFLQIRLRVDECTLEAQAADAGSAVRLTLDGDRGPVFDDDATAVAGWYARQVALACPPG